MLLENGTILVFRRKYSW